MDIMRPDIVAILEARSVEHFRAAEAFQAAATSLRDALRILTPEKMRNYLVKEIKKQMVGGIRKVPRKGSRSERILKFLQEEGPKSYAEIFKEYPKMARSGIYKIIRSGQTYGYFQQNDAGEWEPKP